MAFNSVEAAYGALKLAYRELRKAGDAWVRARKRWQEAVQKAFGANPGNKEKIEAKAFDAEFAFRRADAEYRKALADYQRALANLTRAAALAGLDR